MATLYKKTVKFHDAENLLTICELEITNCNGYKEFTMCNERERSFGQTNFAPKDGAQTELFNIWSQYHLNGMSAGLPIQVQAITEWKKQGNEYDYTKVCDHLKSINLYELPLKANLPEGFFITGKEEISDTETYKYGHGWVYCVIPENFKDTLNDICDRIEEEENNRFDDEELITWDDIDDVKIIALGKHLDIDAREAMEDIEQSSYDDCMYSYSGMDYLVCTDEEADEKEKEAVESIIEECYLSELKHQIKDHPALQYIDMEAWVQDWCGERGENLNRYDSTEYEQLVNDIWYFIYRQ